MKKKKSKIEELLDYQKLLWLLIGEQGKIIQIMMDGANDTAKQVKERGKVYQSIIGRVKENTPKIEGTV